LRNFKTPKGTELPFLNLKGKDYLIVPHRLVWFREEHPDWQIQVEIVDKTDKYVTARATISNAQGFVLQQGHKTEHAAHFPDYLEKAETGAVGRALAMLGYGTAFAQELEEGQTTSGPRIADAPIAAPAIAAKPTTVTPTKPQVVKPGPTLIPTRLTVPFGRTKGTPLSQLTPEEITGAINWAKSVAPKFSDFVEDAEAYLKLTRQTLPPTDNSDYANEQIPF